MSPIANDASLAALGFLCQIFQIERAKKPLDADVDFLSLAVLDCAKFDLHEAKALVDACQVLLIARYAIKSLSDHHIELAGTVPSLSVLSRNDIR